MPSNTQHIPPIPKYMEIWHVKCDNEGCLSEHKKHYFIVCTTEEYNTNSSFVLGIPLTSEPTYYALNFGSNITDEMVSPPFLYKTATYILQDRPCRINRQHLLNKISSIQRPIYRNMLVNIHSFMEFQKLDKKNLL